jgi:hypothetical protein
MIQNNKAGGAGLLLYNTVMKLLSHGLQLFLYNQGIEF